MIESVWTEADQARADLIADIACEVSENEDLVAMVLDAYDARGWLPIESAPKSVSVDTPHGKHVTGKYLLGFCPDEALDPNGCIDTIWWEPNENKGRGGWFGAGATEVRPTHWRPLPSPPQTKDTGHD